MSYPKKLKERARQLATEQDMSAEKIADLFSNEADKKEHDYRPQPRTIRNWLSKGKQESLVTHYDDSSKNHDIEIFKISNSIMSEESLLDFLWPLDGGPPIYYYKKFDSVEKFLIFFSYEGNQYIGHEAKRLCNNLCDSLRKLGAFLSNEFRPPERSGASTYARLLPGELAYAYYSGEKDPEEEPEIYWKCFNELQELKDTCEDCLKKYRAYIRDTLFQ